MANVNTFAALYNLPGPTSSVETAVAAAGSTTTRALLKIRADLAAAQGIVDGRPFKLRVMARATASAASNFAVNVYWNAGTQTDLTTFTDDKSIIGSGNLAMASKSGVMFQEVTLLWDSVSGRLAGMWNGTAGLANLVTTPAIIKTSSAVVTTNPIHASAVTTTDLMQFFVTFSSSGATSPATLIEFSAEQI